MSIKTLLGNPLTILSALGQVAAGTEIIVPHTVKSLKIAMVAPGATETATVILEGSSNPAAGWTQIGSTLLTGNGSLGFIDVATPVANARARVASTSAGVSLSIVVLA